MIVFAALQDRDPQRACTAARDLLTIASSGDSQRLAPQVTAVLRALMPYRGFPRRKTSSTSHARQVSSDDRPG